MSDNNTEYQENFEWIRKRFGSYKKELDWICAKNPYECELYSIIAMVIRCCISDDSISLRDVSRIQKYEGLHTENFMSERGFPDFVILEDKYSTEEIVDKHNVRESGILGAVEIKAMSHDIVKTIKDKKIQLYKEDQIKKHLKYFKKLIYTNGLTWQFLAFHDSKQDKGTHDIERYLSEKFVLGKEIRKKDERKIEWEPNAEINWEKLLDYLKGIDWKLPGRWKKENEK